MITFTTPNTHFQQKWVQKLSDGSKVCMTLTMLLLAFFVNAFNSITQAQSVCPYNITLVSKTYNSSTNQTTFVWSVVNPNPGNGNGTVQDLSWWGFAPNTCPTPGASLTEDDIVKAGYGSSANAATHSSLDVSIKEDKSCDNAGNTPTPVPILKFDRGTYDDDPTYYSLVLEGNWGTGTLNAYYKSGQRTGCGSCTIAGAGVGCEILCPTITVNIIPNTTQLFANRTISLTANISGTSATPYTYLWSSPIAGITFNSTTSATPVATIPAGTSTITFNLTVTDANGCQGTGTITIPEGQICPQIVTPIIGTTSPICPGASNGIITVTNAQAGVTYTLLSGGNPVMGVAAQVGMSGVSTISFTNLGAGTYTVRASYGACPPVTSAAATIGTVTVTAPTAPATPITICAPGGQVTLTATGCAGGTLVWYSAPTGGTPLPSATVNVSATTTYYAACIVSGCESARTPVTVTVTPIPSAPTAPATPIAICGPGQVTLTATGCAGGTLVWYDVATGGTPLPGATVNVTASTTYYVACRIGNCESARTPVPVTVTALPTAPTAPATPITICAPGGQVTLTATGCTGGTLVWYTTMTGGTPLASATVNVTATTTYYVACRIGNCESLRTPVTVTVTPLPGAPSAPPITRCGPGEVTLTASGCAGGTLVWYSVATGGTPLTSATVNVTTSTTYYVACRVGNCEGPRTPVPVTILPAPATNFLLTVASGALCTGGGGSVQIVLSGSQIGVTYQLVRDGMNIGAPVAGTGSAINFGMHTVAGNYSVIAVTSSVDVCVNPCIVTIPGIIIEPAPIPTITPVATPAAVCPGTNIALSATVAGGGTISGIIWTSTNAAVQAGITGSTINTTGLAAGTYTVNFSGTYNGCPVSGSTTITILPAPTVTAAPASVCVGATVQLTGSPAGGTWSGANVSSTGLFSAVGLTAGTYTVTYTYTNASNCSASASATVTVLPAPTVTAAPASVCVGATVQLTGSPAGGTWSGANVSSTGLFSAVGLTAGTYTVTYTYTNASNCSASASATVTVVAPPAVQTPTTVSTCPGVNNGSITFASQTGVTYVLSLTGSTIATLPGTGGSITFGNLAAGAYIITASNTIAPACPVTFNATVGALPKAPCVPITGPANVCMGTTNTYSIQATSCVIGYQWSISGPCIITGTANSPTVNIRAVGPGTFTVNVTLTYTDGTSTTCTGLTVTSTPLPVIANDITVCPPPASQTVTLTASPAGGVWASTNPQIQAAINNTNSTFNATGIPAGTYPVTYTVTNSDGCTGSDLAYITIINNTVIGGLAGRVVASGSTGMEVTMKKSAKGIKYQLYRNGQKVGAPVEGTGRDISFGTQDINGDYSVTASTQDGSCSTSGAAGRIVPTGDPATARVGNLNVTAFPNPFNDRISFTINSEYSGQGALEVYNLLGEKIKTVYQGYIDAGRSQTVDFQVPGAQRVNMIYKLRVGNHETSGKLINIK